MTRKYNVYKTILIGDSNVGKTTLIQNYINEQNNYLSPTVGAAFFPIKKTVCGREITLAIWDTAGQEKYQSMTRLYLRDCSFAIYVFDVTDLNSFLNIENWKLLVDSEVTNDPPLSILVGNKIDLDNCKMTREEIKNFCESHGFCYYIGTNGLTGENVEHLFDKILYFISENTEDTENAEQILSPIQPSTSRCNC